MDHKINIEKDIHIKLGDQRIIFDSVKNGVIITNEDSIIIYANPAVEPITGYKIEEVKGKNPGMFHSGKHDKSFYKEMWQSITTHGFWEGEIWNRKKTGEIYPEFSTISKIREDGTDHYLYIAIFSDISFLKKDIGKKLHLAFYDPLTELPNRNLYLDRVNKSIEQAKIEQDNQRTVFFMDLDKFKQVNDTYGHCVGDQLLKLVGKRLTTITRESDTIARIGGDEFAAIISTGNRKVVIDYAKRIVETLEKPFVIDGQHINISISIGISFYPSDTHDIETLLKQADKAMYLAKKGGTKIECYDNIDGKHAASPFNF